MRLKFYITLLVLGINHQLISQTCNTPEAPGLTCSSAPVLCNLDGYCSTTPSSNPGGDPGPFCGFIENAHWLKFVAGSSNISIEVSPSNCINGLQGQIFFTTRYWLRLGCARFILGGEVLRAVSVPPTIWP